MHMTRFSCFPTGSLYGLSDLDHERVVDKALWSEDDLATYTDSEFEALRGKPIANDSSVEVVDVSNSEHGRVSAWWEGQGHVGEGGQSKYDAFAHMSQRAGWTIEALGCALVTLEIGGNMSTIVETVANQVYEAVALALSQANCTETHGPPRESKYSIKHGVMMVSSNRHHARFAGLCSPPSLKPLRETPCETGAGVAP